MRTIKIKILKYFYFNYWLNIKFSSENFIFNKLALSNIINLFSYLLVIYFSINLYNLELSIPPFKYNFQPIIPELEIANIPVYFLNTSCEFVSIIHCLPKSL